MKNKVPHVLQHPQTRRVSCYIVRGGRTPMHKDTNTSNKYTANNRPRHRDMKRPSRRGWTRRHPDMEGRWECCMLNNQSTACWRRYGVLRSRTGQLTAWTEDGGNTVLRNIVNYVSSEAPLTSEKANQQHRYSESKLPQINDVWNIRWGCDEQGKVVRIKDYFKKLVIIHVSVTTRLSIAK